MFTPVERASLRDGLLRRAGDDERITGVAVTGSAAAGREDRWSDIDLAFGVRGSDLTNAIAEWTAMMYERHGALHHVDVRFGAWLYALHARSSLERKKLWQAEYMISGIRDNVLALMCLRKGLETVHARGVDSLPVEMTRGLKKALVGKLGAPELRRAFRAAIDGLMRETEYVDKGLAERLRAALMALCTAQRTPRKSRAK
jgi:hypothetical protein